LRVDGEDVPGNLVPLAVGRDRVRVDVVLGAEARAAVSAP
jgi:hypothetical protein